tara:strand:+ start:374 stop:1087 length:714 start_codon:yes stop_codon:yes gene_type:complete
MKRIVLIGSEGKIGSKFQAHLIKNGYKVLSFDKKKIKRSNYFCKDINTELGIKSLCKISLKKLKKIDCVINCSYPIKKIKKIDFANFKETSKYISSHISTNIILAKYFSKIFKKQNKGGQMIFIGSIQSIAAPKFSHYESTNLFSPIEYTASKYAMVGIVKYLAKYFGKYKIKFNMLSPGGILSNQNKKFIKKYRKSCLTKGMLDTEDLLSGLDFLIDERSSAFNGQNLIIDDGWSL